MDLLTILPEELLELLITYLDGFSTLYLGSTCSILHQLTSQPRVWRRHLSRITTITREVENLAKGDLKAIFLHSNRLKKHWISGVVKENELCSQVSRMLQGPVLQMFAANETWAVRVNLKPEDKDGFLEAYNLLEGSSGHGFDFANTVDLVDDKIVERIFVLESFIIILRKATAEHMTADLMVFSIQDQKYLYNQEAAIDLRYYFPQGVKDVTNFKNYILAVRNKSTTLYHVMEEKVIVKELEMEENIQGALQDCKFMAWNETHMAHPFQAYPPSDEWIFDAEVEHRIYCWDQATWNPKIFRIMGKVRHKQVTALHAGKLFALEVAILALKGQVSAVRIWDVELGALEKVTLFEVTPVFGSIPAFEGNHLPKFLMRDNLGIHLHPATQVFVGVESNTLQGGVVAVSMYSVKIINFEGEMLAFLDIPKEKIKNKRQIKIHLVGPRLVVLYSDNSYSVVDLEVETSKARYDPCQRELLPVFPLGSAHKKGTLVTQRGLLISTDPGFYCQPYFTHVSQFNIVISHCSKYPSPMDYVHTFNFL